MHIIVFWRERVLHGLCMEKKLPGFGAGAVLRLTPREGQPRQWACTHAHTPCAAARLTREQGAGLCRTVHGVQSGAHKHTCKGAAANAEARCFCLRGPTKAMGTHAHAVRKREACAGGTHEGGGRSGVALSVQRRAPRL